MYKLIREEWFKRLKEGDGEWLNWKLEITGFQKVNKPPIMIKNREQLVKRNSELYSIAAQIFG